jgi:REase_DpnII-MboI
MGDANRERLREFIKWMDGLIRAMDASVRVENTNDLWIHSGFMQFARKYNELVKLIAAEVQLPPIFPIYKTDTLTNGNTVPSTRKAVFDSVYADLCVLKGVLEGQLGVVDDQTESLRNFIQARLRSAVMHPPNKEFDIQDAIEALLIGRGLQKGTDYDREVGRVKVSAKEVVPDFIFPPLQLALEVKLVRTSAKIRVVIDEINADIAAYSKSYRSLIFVVYDLGQIQDEVEFKQDLDNSGNVSIVVVKH